MTESQDQEKRVQQLKHDLEAWREVLLPANALLTWEKQWFPAVLIGIVTFIFLLLWYFDPSVLTTVALAGLFFTIVDYLVPKVSSSFINPDSWTGSKEKKYEDICNGLAQARTQLSGMWSLLSEMKETKPKIYFTAVVTTLLVLAWIGNMVNNLFLTYLIVCFLVLFPGMMHHRLLHKYFAYVVLTIANMIKGEKKKKN